MLAANPQFSFEESWFAVGQAQNDVSDELEVPLSRVLSSSEIVSSSIFGFFVFS